MASPAVPTWTWDGAARWAPLPLPAEGKSGFSLLPGAETGIHFTNVLADAASAINRVLENGSGVAIGDYDSDGLPDLLLCSLTGQNSLYRNLGGWRFEAITKSGLATLSVPCRGAVFADLNGDSTLDLLVATVSDGLRCYRNDGKGNFVDATAESGLRARSGATTMALADVDGNGTLDLYVTNYRTDDIRDRARIDIRRVNGKVMVAPSLQDRVAITSTGLLEYGERDVLYLNDGKGHFSAASPGRFWDERGKPIESMPKDWGLSASFRDLNGDGAPDLYVCNDYWTRDRIWLNDGTGNFKALPSLAMRHSSANSMGVDFADINGDGFVDFFVTDMLGRGGARQKRQLRAQAASPFEPEREQECPQGMQNTLFLNRGDCTFAEIAEFSGLAASDWSWQPVFIDVDLDGLEDLIIPAGHSRDVQDADTTALIQSLQHPWAREMSAEAHQHAFTREVREHNRLYPSAAAPIFAFRNLGNLQFEDLTRAWGTSQVGVHQGIAFADLDGDGDLDFIVNNLNGATGVYRNNSGVSRVAVRLKGRPPNTAGIGAKIALQGGAVPRQRREVASGGRYLSGFDTLAVFATGQRDGSMQLDVEWRNRSHTVVTNVQAGRLYEITE